MKIVVTYNDGDYLQTRCVNTESLEWLYCEFEKNVNRLIKEDREYNLALDELSNKIKLFHSNHNEEKHKIAVEQWIEIRKKETNWNVKIADTEWSLNYFRELKDNDFIFSPPEIQTLDEWFEDKLKNQ